MRTYTLSLVVALTSLLVTFSSAKGFDKENSVNSILQDIDSRGTYNFYEKRELRKRLYHPIILKENSPDYSLVARSSGVGSSKTDHSSAGAYDVDANGNPIYQESGPLEGFGIIAPLLGVLDTPP